MDGWENVQYDQSHWSRVRGSTGRDVAETGEISNWPSALMSIMLFDKIPREWLQSHVTYINIGSQFQCLNPAKVNSAKMWQSPILDRSQPLFYFVPHSQAGSSRVNVFLLFCQIDWNLFHAMIKSRYHWIFCNWPKFCLWPQILGFLLEFSRASVMGLAIRGKCPIREYWG